MRGKEAIRVFPLQEPGPELLRAGVRHRHAPKEFFKQHKSPRSCLFYRHYNFGVDHFQKTEMPNDEKEYPN